MKHICGKCNVEFESEKEYLDHVCGKTGFTPRDPPHQGVWFEDVSKAALERGNTRAKLEAEGKTREEAIALTRDIKGPPIVK